MKDKNKVSKELLTAQQQNPTVKKETLNLWNVIRTMNVAELKHYRGIVFDQYQRHGKGLGRISLDAMESTIAFIDAQIKSKTY